jgi:hypothetical protein
LFAINAEQVTVVLLGVIGCLIIHNLWQKRLSVYLLVQFIVTGAGVLFILTSPGNHARMLTETQRWFPLFEDIGLTVKIQFGFATTITHFIFTPNLIFLVTCALVNILVHVQYPGWKIRALAGIPLIICIWCAFGQSNEYLNGLRSFGDAPDIIIIAENFMQWERWMPFIIQILSCLCILASIFFCFGKEKCKALFCIALILCGYASRALIGFSPTLWASKERTFVFMYFAFLICIAMLYQRMTQLEYRYKGGCFYVFGGFAFLSYLTYVEYVIACALEAGT